MDESLVNRFNFTQMKLISFQKLGEKGLSYPYPSPLAVFWMFDHPPTGERVTFAASYRPWDQGLAPRYVR